jgi:hypothetical protein
MIPNPDTYCEIDPKVVDKWGIPVLRFHFAWSDHEIKMAKDMQETFRAIVEAAEERLFHQRPAKPSPGNGGTSRRGTALRNLRRGRDHS